LPRASKGREVRAEVWRAVVMAKTVQQKRKRPVEQSTGHSV
jgi:hypothetical protein